MENKLTEVENVKKAAIQQTHKIEFKKQQQALMEKRKQLHHIQKLELIQKRRQKEEQCQHSKVRTYACDDEGFRNVQYINFEYNFEQDKCVEHVQTKELQCHESPVEHIQHMRV